MPFNWIHRMIGDRRPGARPAARKQVTRPAHLGRRTRLGFDLLEGRCVPAVTITGGFDGADGNSPAAGEPSPPGAPPNVQVAYGPTASLQTYSAGAVLTSNTGLFAPVTQDLSDGSFFPRSGGPTSTFLSPFVVYDDNAQRYIFGEIENDPIQQQSYLHFAVSNNSTPTDFMASFTEIQSINITQTGAAIGDPLFAADPNIGFNQDGIFFTFNMKSFINSSRYDHTQILAVQTSTVTDADPTTIFFEPVANVGTGGFNRPSPNFGMVPAREHNAPAGTPEYFVSTYGQQLETGNVFSSTALLVTKMTNYFTVNPGYITTTLAVANFGSSTNQLNAVTLNGTNSGISPPIIQPGNSGHGTTIIGLDTQIVSAAWQNNTLVAAHTAEVNNQATVAWYQISTANVSTAALVQSGDLPQSPGVYTYAPSIDIANNGDIGLAYGQSSAVQFPSMYVTGRTPTDPGNKMEAAVLVKAGETTLGSPAGTMITPIVPTPQPVASSTDPTNWFNTIFIFPYAFMTSQLVDRSGMTPAAGTAGTHTNLPFDPVTDLGTMWRTDPASAAPVVGATLDFNFGVVLSLNKVHIWNYNDTYAAATDFAFNPDPFVGTQFGAQNISFETSTDGVTWSMPIQTSFLARANGSNADPGSDVLFNIPIFTQYLRIVINSNYTAANTGVVGLSEIQFYQNPPPANLVGYYSSTQVDPLNPNTFVGINTYSKNISPPIENFGSWISTFRLEAAVTQTTAGLNPVRWVMSPTTGLFTGTYNLTNNGAAITASGDQLFVTIVLPDPSITVASTIVGAIQVGNLYEIPINGTFAAGQTMKFTVTLADPLKLALPTSITSGSIFVN
jgi:hypothetical protein